MTYLKILLVTFILAFSFLPWPTQAISINSCMEEQCIVYFNKWKTMANEKDASAMSTVAELYYQGYGTEKNLSKSIHYFRQASRLQFTHAQYRTGVFYLMEEDFIDHQEGLKYLRIAAVNDHTESAFLLAVIYGTGELGIKDVGESDKWLEKALQLKHVKAGQYARSLYKSGQVNEEHYVKVNAFISSLIGTMPETETETGKVARAKVDIQWLHNSNQDVMAVPVSGLKGNFDYVKAAFKIQSPEIKANAEPESEKISCAKLFSCYLVDKKAPRDSSPNVISY